MSLLQSILGGVISYLEATWRLISPRAPPPSPASPPPSPPPPHEECANEVLYY